MSEREGLTDEECDGEPGSICVADHERTVHHTMVLSDNIPTVKETHMITQSEIETRFTYHAPKPGQPETYQGLRDNAKELAALIVLWTPESREQSLALTALEEAVMWANAAIACRG